MRQLRIDDSSNVLSASFSEAGLEIEFKSGALYVYKNVQAHQFGELAAANSVGKYVQQFIRNPTTYPVKKIRETRADGDDLEKELQESVYKRALEEIAQAVEEQLNDYGRQFRQIARKALGRE